jgi:hypothetical protein
MNSMLRKAGSCFHPDVAMRSSILKAGEGLGEVFGNPCKHSPTVFPPKTDIVKLLGEVLGEIFFKKVPCLLIWIEKKALFPQPLGEVGEPSISKIVNEGEHD